MNFKEKVQSLTARELVMAMVEGLENPAVAVDMNTFGEVVEGVCYGCAATNAVFRLSELQVDKSNILQWRRSQQLCDFGTVFVEQFECAIDYLRVGDVKAYNTFAHSADITYLPTNEYLPMLLNDDWKEYLPAYKAWAQSLPNKKLTRNDI